MTTFEHVLVHVEPGLASIARLKYAVGLARHFGARLTGLTVTLPPAELPATMMIGDAHLFNAAVEVAEQSAAFARKQFAALLRDGGLEAQWRNGEGVPADVVSAEGGCSDLVILGSRAHRNPDGGLYMLDPADVAMRCGRPVIVIPDEAPESYDIRRVVLAWTNTRESARAAHDALPLLQQAEEVLLTEVTSVSRSNHYELPVGAMADHLRSHAVNLTVHRLHDRTRKAGELLIDFAADRHADLIVAGAYGHSRIREWVLGGVTASLLNFARVPCFLSH